MSNPADQFAKAFNDRDMDAIQQLLDPAVTAQVINSPFPVEKGPADMGEKSLPYMLGNNDLSAQAFRHNDMDWVLFLANGALDCAAGIQSSGSLITRVEYFVVPHAPDVVAEIAGARGVPVAEDSPDA